MDNIEVIFEDVLKELYNLDQPIQADYNALQETNFSENSGLVSYMNEVLTGISTIYTFLEDMKSSLYAMVRLSNNDDEERARFIVSELEDELKDFHIKIKSLWDVIVRFVATVFRLKIKNKFKFYSELEEKLPDNNQISDCLEAINNHIDSFDKGRRNKIIHEGIYEDDEIKDAHLDGMLRGIHKRIKYKNSLAEEVNELVLTKLKSAEQVCIDVLKQFSDVIEILDEEYYENEKELSGLQ